MAERVLINGRPYEVIEWDQRDPDIDGDGISEWTAYARRLDDHNPVPDVDPDMFDAYQITSSSEVYLTCPRTGCQTEIHETLDQVAAGDPLTLGALMDLAIDHEAEHGGHKPEHCETVDLPGIGPTRVNGHFNGRSHMAEVVRAAQRRALEELKAEARAELREQLRDVRARWDARRKEREACRETVDGQTARLASIEHDIYATVLHELDAVLTGAENTR